MNTDVRTLLLVDSDPAEGPELAARLREAGYDVDLAVDLKRAIEQATSVPYAIVVTELDLPGGGTELIRRVRELGETAPPVLVLSRRTDEIDRVVAFEVGAADYLPRPYYFRELLLRLRAGPAPRPPWSTTAPCPSSRSRGSRPWRGSRWSSRRRSVSCSPPS